MASAPLAHGPRTPSAHGGPAHPSDSGFHAPSDGRPLILIGNGTGLAGLRSLLKARIHAGQTATG